MTTMKKLLLTCAALASLAAAGPAAAQRWDGDWGAFNARESRAEYRINHCPGISWREARWLRSELNDIQRIERRYRNGGLSPREFRDLERRMDRLERRINGECHDYNRHGGYRGPGGYRDGDHDGVPNRYDHDLDNDGVRNRNDRDIDGDGVRNRNDRDRDGDGVRNRWDRRPNR